MEDNCTDEYENYDNDGDDVNHNDSNPNNATSNTATNDATAENMADISMMDGPYDDDDDNHNNRNTNQLLLLQQQQMLESSMDDDDDHDDSNKKTTLLFPVLPLKKNLSQCYFDNVVVSTNNNNNMSNSHWSNATTNNNNGTIKVNSSSHVATKVQLYEATKMTTNNSTSIASTGMTKMSKNGLQQQRIHSSNANAKSTTATSVGSGGLPVYLRIRPVHSTNSMANDNNLTATAIATDAKTTIELVDTMNSSTNTISKIRTVAPESSNASKFARGGGTAIVKEYEFTQVFDEHANQESIYDTIISKRNILPDFVHQQQSALLFCYGITNAGKTYTMTGDCGNSANANDIGVTATTSTATIQKTLLDIANNSSSATRTESDKMGSNHTSSWGLIPRTLQDLLELCYHNTMNHNNSTTTYALQLSYFEIYNEQFIDLLPIDSIHNNNSTSNNSSTNPLLRGIKKHSINNLADGLKLISMAQKNRRSGTNNINSVSSRSHSICQFHVTCTKDVAESTTSPTTAAADLWIVDLAGNERTKRTGGTRKQETIDINKSLMTLNRCLVSLRSMHQAPNPTAGGTIAGGSHPNTSIVIPYRDSKLTQLFGQHFTSKYAYRTIMIVNVNPSIEDYDETQYVLNYASSAKSVQLQNSGSNDEDNKSSATMMMTQYGLDGRRIIHPNNNSKKDHCDKNGNTKQFALTTALPMDRKRKAVATTTASNTANSSTVTETCNIFRNDDTLIKNDKTGKNNDDNSNNSNKRFRTGTVVGSSAAGAILPPLQNITGIPTITNTSFNNKSSNDDIKEMQRLKMELSVSNAENFTLKQQNNELLEQMKNIEEHVETEVRQEVGTEIELVIERYEKLLAQQQQQQQKNHSFTMNQSHQHEPSLLSSSRTSSNSFRNSVGSFNDNGNDVESIHSHKKLTTLVIELKEQIQECEDEMKRMKAMYENKLHNVRDEHVNDLHSLKQNYEKLLLLPSHSTEAILNPKEKNKEDNDSCNVESSTEIAKSNQTEDNICKSIESLKNDLNEQQLQFESLMKEKNELVKEVEILRSTIETLKQQQSERQVSSDDAETMDKRANNPLKNYDDKNHYKVIEVRNDLTMNDENSINGRRILRNFPKQLDSQELAIAPECGDKDTKTIMEKSSASKHHQRINIPSSQQLQNSQSPPRRITRRSAKNILEGDKKVVETISKKESSAISTSNNNATGDAPNMITRLTRRSTRRAFGSLTNCN